MGVQENIETVKQFFVAMGEGDRPKLLSLTSEDIEWIIPGQNWALAGTHRGHEGLQRLLQISSDAVDTKFPEPPEYVAQGDKVHVVGFAQGTVAATGKTFDDNFVFAITIRDGKLTNIREYVDTQALARASE